MLTIVCRSYTLAIVDLTLKMRKVAMTSTTKALGLMILTTTLTLMMLMRVALALMMSVGNSSFDNDFLTSMKLTTVVLIFFADDYKTMKSDVAKTAKNTPLMSAALSM
jgi:hypothetical protein